MTHGSPPCQPTRATRHENGVEHQFRLAAGSRVIRSDRILEATRDQEDATRGKIYRRMACVSPPVLMSGSDYSCVLFVFSRQMHEQLLDPVGGPGKISNNSPAEWSLVAGNEVPTLQASRLLSHL